MTERPAGAGLAGSIVSLDLEAVSERRGWFIALGILLIVLGMIAIGAPFATGCRAA